MKFHAENAPERSAALPTGPTGLNAWLDFLVRLSHAPVAGIAKIRGRTRGGGSEFVLACDVRFASRENTLLGQFEVARLRNEGCSWRPRHFPAARSRWPRV